jgi:predicted DNA-binding ribbon-helix-helix protein
MSKRLQVLLEESELKKIQQIARRKGMTVAEWVRQTLRAARSQEPVITSARKIKVLEAALKHHFPAGDIENMLDEIEQGYLGRKTS